MSVWSNLNRRLENANNAFLLAQFGVARQVSFLDGVFTLVKDGIAPRDALQLMVRTGDQIEQQVARALIRRMREGMSLARGMERLFRPDLTFAVAATEQSERFGEAGLGVVEHMREQLETRQGVIGKLAVPLLYVFFAAALYGAFAYAIWPRFEAMVPLESWNRLAYSNYTVGKFIIERGPFVLAFLGLAGFAVGVVLRRWSGPRRRLLDRVWPFTLYRGLAATGVLESLGTLLVAGQDFRTAVNTAARHSAPFVRYYLELVRRRLREGHNIALSLDVGFFADGDMARLKLLAEYHGLREVMVRMGVASRRAILAQLRAIANALNFAGIALVAFSYAGLIISLYLLSMQIQQALTSQ